MTAIKPTRQEKAWLKRAQKLVDTLPPGVWVYVTGQGTTQINLMRLAADGSRVMDGFGGASSDQVVGVIDAPGWDAGAW